MSSKTILAAVLVLFVLPSAAAVEVNFNAEDSDVHAAVSYSDTIQYVGGETAEKTYMYEPSSIYVEGRTLPDVSAAIGFELTEVGEILADNSLSDSQAADELNRAAYVVNGSAWDGSAVRSLREELADSPVKSTQGRASVPASVDMRNGPMVEVKVEEASIDWEKNEARAAVKFGSHSINITFVESVQFAGSGATWRGFAISENGSYAAAVEDGPNNGELTAYLIDPSGWTVLDSVADNGDGSAETIGPNSVDFVVSDDGNEAIIVTGREEGDSGAYMGAYSFAGESLTREVTRVVGSGPNGYTGAVPEPDGGPLFTSVTNRDGEACVFELQGPTPGWAISEQDCLTLSSNDATYAVWNGSSGLGAMDDAGTFFHLNYDGSLSQVCQTSIGSGGWGEDSIVGHGSFFYASPGNSSVHRLDGSCTVSAFYDSGFQGQTALDYIPLEDGIVGAGWGNGGVSFLFSGNLTEKDAFSGGSDQIEGVGYTDAENEALFLSTDGNGYVYSVESTTADAIDHLNVRPDGFGFWQDGPFFSATNGNRGEIPFRYQVNVSLPSGYDHAEPGVGVWFPDGSLETCGVGDVQLGDGVHNVSCNEPLKTQAASQGSYDFYIETCIVDSDGPEPTQCFQTSNMSFALNETLDQTASIPTLQGNSTVFNTVQPNITRSYSHNPAVSGLHEVNRSAVQSVLYHQGPGDSSFSVWLGSTIPALPPYDPDESFQFDQDLEPGTHLARIDSQVCEDGTNQAEGCETLILSDTYEFDVVIGQGDEDVLLIGQSPTGGETVEYPEGTSALVDLVAYLESNTVGNLTWFVAEEGGNFSSVGSFDGAGPVTEGQNFTLSDVNLSNEGNYSWYAEYETQAGTVYNSTAFDFELVESEDGGAPGEGAFNFMDFIKESLADLLNLSVQEVEYLLAILLTVALMAGIASVSWEVAVFSGVAALVFFVLIEWLPVGVLIILAVAAAGILYHAVAG